MSEQLTFPSLEPTDRDQQPIDLYTLAYRVGHQARPIEYSETATERYLGDIGGRGVGGREMNIRRIAECRAILDQTKK